MQISVKRTKKDEHEHEQELEQAHQEKDQGQGQGQGQGQRQGQEQEREQLPVDQLLVVETSPGTSVIVAGTVISIMHIGVKRRKKDTT